MGNFESAEKLGLREKETNKVLAVYPYKAEGSDAEINEFKDGHFGVLLELDSEEEINQLYKALLEGGSAFMELQKTFWWVLNAVVIDHLGVSWTLNYTLGKGETGGCAAV